MAPNAPCVLVCESPQAIVVPGCVMPCSGPTICTMPCLPVERSKNVMPVSAQFRAQLLDHCVGERIGEGLRKLIGRHYMIDGRERTMRHRDLQPEIAHHAERLRARHLMDQVRPDQQLRLAVREGTHRMGVPDFLEKGFGHGI